MLITNVKNGAKRHLIEITAVLGDTEFEQLGGQLKGICVFSPVRISERASYTLTGARHATTKYLLLPKTLRREFRPGDFDFEKLQCGFIKYLDRIFIIYSVPLRLSTAAFNANEEQ